MSPLANDPILASQAEYRTVPITEVSTYTQAPSTVYHTSTEDVTITQISKAPGTTIYKTATEFENATSVVTQYKPTTIVSTISASCTPEIPVTPPKNQTITITATPSASVQTSYVTKVSTISASAPAQQNLTITHVSTLTAYKPGKPTTIVSTASASCTPESPVSPSNQTITQYSTLTAYKPGKESTTTVTEQAPQGYGGASTVTITKSAEAPPAYPTTVTAKASPTTIYETRSIVITQTAKPVTEWATASGTTVTISGQCPTSSATPTSSAAPSATGYGWRA
ncbi:hypothetical protein PRZ48_006254 [Zasmidium cellare]|uniref:Uncharacterized protein n=1 Tax=Zasmidium cellare TaxID=395010 RepID=A0ABR0EP01_ZASCE|nr:hypothetical protein PRZ48_006254 [Zasmidium cellare]